MLQEQLRGYRRCAGYALYYTGNDRLESPSERVIDHVIGGRRQLCCYIRAPPAETPTLSADEKLDLIKFTFEKVSKRVPVVVGIGDYNTQRCGKTPGNLSARRGGRRAQRCALLQQTYPGRYLTSTIRPLPPLLPKPIILYNVPGRTGRNMTADTTLRIANEVDNVIAMKEASGDMIQCMQIIRRKAEGFPGDQW